MQISANEGLVVGDSLCIINESGDTLNTVDSGYFSDACMTDNGTVYALKCRKEGEVVPIHKVGNDWEKQGGIILFAYESDNFHHYSGINYPGSDMNTLVVSYNDIFVAISHKHTIIRYDMSGHRLHILVKDAKLFKQPSICGMNNDKLLIAHRQSSRLDQLEITGKIVPLEGFNCSSQFAIFQSNSKLWVLTENSQLLKYSFE